MTWTVDTSQDPRVIQRKASGFWSNGVPRLVEVSAIPGSRAIMTTHSGSRWADGTLVLEVSIRFAMPPTMLSPHRSRLLRAHRPHPPRAVSGVSAPALWTAPVTVHNRLMRPRWRTRQLLGLGSSRLWLVAVGVVKQAQNQLRVLLRCPSSNISEMLVLNFDVLSAFGRRRTLSGKSTRRESLHRQLKTRIRHLSEQDRPRRLRHPRVRNASALNARALMDLGKR